MPRSDQSGVILIEQTEAVRATGLVQLVGSHSHSHALTVKSVPAAGCKEWR